MFLALKSYVPEHIEMDCYWKTDVLHCLKQRSGAEKNFSTAIDVSYAVMNSRYGSFIVTNHPRICFGGDMLV